MDVQIYTGSPGLYRKLILSTPTPGLKKGKFTKQFLPEITLCPDLQRKLLSATHTHKKVGVGIEFFFTYRKKLEIR